MQDLQQLLLEKELWESTAIFVGAGASVGPGLFPTWMELVKELRSITNLKTPEIGDLLEIADRAYKKDPEEYNRTILGIFADPKQAQQKLINNLKDLKPKFFVTTNYDSTLSHALHATRGPQKGGFPGRKVYTYEDLPSVSQIERNSVLHIHGFIEEGQNSEPRIILNASDYKAHYEESSDLPDFLRGLFSSYHIIFVGFSFDDKYISQILESSKASEKYVKKRYAFMPVPQHNIKFDSIESHPINIERAKEILDKCDKCGVSVIWYDPRLNHHNLQDIMHKLVDFANSMTRAEEGQTQLSRDLLTRGIMREEW